MTPPAADDEDRTARRYRSLVEATATEVFVNHPDGRLLSDLPAWRAVTGQTTEQLLGDGWLDVLHPDDRARVDRAWREAVRHRSSYEFEYRIRAQGGGWRTLWVRGTPVLGDDGEVEEFIGLYYDITDEVRLRERSERDAQVLRAVIEQSPMAICLFWGPDHRYRLFNARYTELVPSDRELLGRPLLEALPEAAGVAEVLDRALAGETATVRDFAVPFGGPGSYRGKRYYTFTYSPVRGPEGRPGGVLATIVEGTAEVRRRAELEQALGWERDAAQVLQRSLLAQLPAVAGIVSCGRYLPAGPEIDVGGDFFDVIPLDDGCVVLAIGDVAGRGLPAASTMNQMRAALRAYAVEDPAPAAMLARLNDFVDAMSLAMTTLAYAVLDPRSGRLRYALAGHPAPLLIGGGTASPLLGARNPPLGAPFSGFAEDAVELPLHSTLLLYTDGIVEERGEPLNVGIDRLAAHALQLLPETALEQACDRLVDGEPSAHDDRALLAVRRTG